MPVPSNPQDLINIIREKLFNNTSGLIEEPDVREVLENIVKVLDAKFSLLSPNLTEEQFTQWNLIIDYMAKETKGVLSPTSPAPTEKGKYLLSIPGTYTNIGGLVAAADKLNYAYFDGSTWSLIAADLPQPIVNNYTNNNTYNLDPEQIVPSEATYQDDTLAGDILKRVDKATGENVNYRETTTWYDGTQMDDSKVDEVIYFKSGNKYYKRVFEEVNVRWFKKTTDTNDTDSFNRAIAALPSSGGVINIPNGNYTLSDSVSTGEKKVIFKAKAVTINLPQGKHGFILQKNGSKFLGAGRGITYLKHSSSVVTYPTVNLQLSGGAVSGTTISNEGAGLISTPVILTGESSEKNEAGLVANVNEGKLNSIEIIAAGSGYVPNTSVNFIGGGASAVMIDNVQSCEVSDFTVDFSNSVGSIGVYHSGGWWADISRIDTKYNNLTGERSEHETSLLLVVNSYTLGTPGANGAWGGIFVSNYSNLSGLKMAIIGHDISTATTLQFNTCDFQNRYYFAVVGITEINAVAQADLGAFWLLVNVDSLSIVGGDMEGNSNWFHSIGSNSNIRIFNTLAYSAHGQIVRGNIGVGWEINPARTNSTEEKLFVGSGGNAGLAYQNTGWKIKHRQGIHFSGDVYVIASSNMKLISETKANLDDTSVSGFALIINPYGEMKVLYATPGTNPVDCNVLGVWNSNSVDTHQYKVDGVRVVSNRQPALPTDATDQTSAYTLINAIKQTLINHGLVEN